MKFKLILRQSLVLILTFWGYAALHATRQSFSNLKSKMEDNWGFSKHLEGGMDTIFMFFYAVGLYSSGIIGDKFDAKLVYALGLFLTGIVISLFACFYPIFNVAPNDTKNEAYYLIIWMFNGLIQSTGWPTSVKIMANWFDEEHSGFIFGLWSANASFGNILGSIIVNYVLNNNYSIQYAYYICTIQLFIVAFLILTLIQTQPSPHLLIKNDTNQNETINFTDNNDISKDNTSEIKAYPPISFIKALTIPNVIIYALCYACLKSVNYTMFFWLPYFLDNNFSSDVSDNLAIVYNVSQIFGGWICGYISDYINKRSPPIFIFLVLCIPSVLLLRIPSKSVYFFGILAGINGFLIGGPANIISSAIAADLGKHKSLNNNPRALAKVAGIIDGTGSIGAAFVQYLVSWISDISWDLVFMVLSFMVILSSLLIIKLFVHDIKSLIKHGIIKNESKLDNMEYHPIIRDD